MSKNERFHYVWQCCASTEVRGRRNTYEDKSCGVHNVHSCKKEITLDHRPQATKCWFCGKRPRLSPLNAEYFFTKEDAIRTAFNRNEDYRREHFPEHISEDYCE